jgi:hypothetical protein
MRRSVAAAVCTALAACAACGGEAQQDAAGARVAATSDTSDDAPNQASSEEWKHAGWDIIADRQKNAADRAAGLPVFPSSTFGPYLTHPIDVTGNGVYELTLGPLTAADAAAEQVGGRSWPGDTAFVADVRPELTTFMGADGKTYGRLILNVTEFEAPYKGFTAWTQ